MLRILVISLLGLVAGAPMGQQQTPCDVCQLLVGELQDLLTTSQLKDSVEDYVRDICSRLPGEEKDTCLAFTREYAGPVFSKLNLDLSPKKFCENIPDVCPSEPTGVTDKNVQGPVECAICELAVLGIDRVIKTNSSAAEINGTLLKFCAGLPYDLTDMCLRIEPEIVKVVQNGLDPKVACKVARLCILSNRDVVNTVPCDVCHTAIDAMGVSDTDSVCKDLDSCKGETEGTEAIEPSVTDDAGCEICKLFVTYIDNAVKTNTTISSLNNTLLGICNIVPANFKETCEGVVPIILGAIGNGVDPNQACIDTNFCPNVTSANPCEVCKAVAKNNEGQFNEEILDTTCTELCQSRTRRSAALNFEIINTLPSLKEHECKDAGCKEAGCTACKLLVQGLDLIIGNNFTVETVDMTMTGICNAMAGESTREQCTQTIPKLVELLKDGADPEDACKVIGLCTAAPVRSRRSKTMRSLDMKKKVAHENEKNTLKMGDSLECEICDYVVKIVDMLLEENVTTSAINETLNNICVNLPATALQQACLGAIPKIMALLEKGVLPKDTCVKLKLCNSNKDDTFDHVMPSKVDLKCDTCEFVFTELGKELKDNATDAVINSTVYGICGKLKGALNDLCRSAAPSIVTSVENGNVDPKKACTDLKLCQPAVNKIETTPPLKVDYKCDVCDFVIREVDKGLADNATDFKLNATVYGACYSLEGFLQDLCLANAQKLVDTIEKGFDPNGVCGLLRLCNTTTENIAIKEDSAAVIKTNKIAVAQVDYKCDICTFVVEEVDKGLADNATDVKLNATVYGACFKQSGFLRDLCLANAQKIIDGIEKGFDVKGVCKLVKLCNTTAQKTSYKLPNLKPSKLGCDVCQYVVKKADAEIGKNASEKLINSTVYGICAKLTDVKLELLCMTAAPLIVNELVKGGDPAKVCQQIKMCNATNLPVKVESKPATKLQDVKCTLCELAIKEIDSIIAQNGSIDQINSTLYGFCNKLSGSLQNVCLQAVPQIVNALSSGADPQQTCTLIKLCGATDTESKPVEQLQDVKCTLCELAIKEIDSIIAQNGSIDQINSTLYGFCNKLSGSLQNVCLQAVPQIVNALSSGADPQQTCTLIKLCGATDTESEPAEQLQDVKCTLCELAIKEIDSIIAQNGSIDQINSTLYGFCNKLSGSLQNVCLQAVPQIVNALSSGADPQQTCTLIKLCGATDTEDTESKPVDQLQDVKCTLCELAIKELDSILANNGTEEQINAKLNEFCDKLKGEFKNLCVEAVPVIVKALANGADPEEACTLIKLCDASDINTKSASQAVENLKDVKCTLCELAIKEVDSIIAKNGSIEQINSTLYEFCNKLSGSLQKVCLEAVPQILKALSSGADPEQTCTLINLCGATDVNTQPTSEVTGNLQDVKCTLCELAVKEVDSILARNGSIEQINTTLNEFCGRLSGNLQQVCVELVPKILAALSSGADPDQTCALVKLCGATDVITQSASPAVDNLKDAKCTLCELAVKEIDSIVEQNGTVEAINSTLHEFCNKLSGEFKILCLGAVPTIVMAMKAGVDPEEACTLLTLCATTAEEINIVPAKVKLDCQSCQSALQHVYDSVQQDYPKVQNVLTQLCEGLPRDYQPMCLTVLQENNGVSFKTLLQSYSPVLMCEMAQCVESQNKPTFTNLS